MGITSSFFVDHRVVFVPKTGYFVAKEKFVVDTRDNAPVKISAVWENFTNWFLVGDGKIEGPNDRRALHCAKSRRASVGRPIIDLLGGEGEVETLLADIRHMVEKQGNGQNGVLLVDGSINVFHVRDQKLILRTVYLCWCEDGWIFSADSVGVLRGWNSQRYYQVFSRKPLVESLDLVPA